MRVIKIAVVCFAAFIFFACIKPRESTDEMSRTFSPLALQGKEIFEAKSCNACHYVGEEAVDAEAPDLSDPFIANDSLFVQTHLKFVELSQMPSVELTQDEIRLLGHYIAELHRSKNPTVSPEEADTICPVCYAPVSRKQARSAKLVISFLKERYYFECTDCMEAFKKAPEAFLQLLEMYETENQNKVTNN